MDDAAAVFAAPKQTSYENTYRTSPEEYGEVSRGGILLILADMLL